MDTGSASLMREDCYHKIGKPSLINHQINFNTIGSKANETLGKTQETRIDNCVYEVTFHIVPNSYMTYDALTGFDFLNKVIMKLEEGETIIISIPEQNSYWAQLNKINVAEETDQIDLIHITNQDNKNMIKTLIAEYKINKFKEIGIELNIVLQDDIPIYQRA